MFQTREMPDFPEQSTNLAFLIVEHLLSGLSFQPFCYCMPACNSIEKCSNRKKLFFFQDSFKQWQKWRITFCFGNGKLQLKSKKRRQCLQRLLSHPHELHHFAFRLFRHLFAPVRVQTGPEEQNVDDQRKREEDFGQDPEFPSDCRSELARSF